MTNSLKTPNVSIVIPNYNGEDLLQQNIPSVLNSMAAYGGAAELIVVDDGSTDNSINLIKTHFTDIKLVEHEQNRGFSEAIHSGVNNSAYDIVILLNSDVIPDRDFINPLLEWFSRDDVFSVSPLIYGEKSDIHRVSKNNPRITKGKLRPQIWDLNQELALTTSGQPSYHLYGSGGSIAVRKSMFIELSGFLSIFKPFYFEDTDLGIRACRNKWKNIFDPRSSVVHPPSQTIRKYNKRFAVRSTYYRNGIILLWLHLPIRLIIINHLPWLILRFISDLLRFDVAKVASVFLASRSLPEVIKLRRDFKNSGLKPLDEIIEKL